MPATAQDMIQLHVRIMKMARRTMQQHGIEERAAVERYLSALDFQWPKTAAAYREWLDENDSGFGKSIAYSMGGSACGNDVSINSNPFDEGTQDHDEWNDGWVEFSESHP